MPKRVRPEVQGTAKMMSFQIYEPDQELLDYIQERLGIYKSEAIRTAIRTFAAHLAFLEQRSTPGRKPQS